MEQEKQYKDVFNVRNKERIKKEQIVEYIGDLLNPETEGFEQVNMDMAFTYLGNFDLALVDNLSMSITMTKIYGLKQANVLLRGQMATFLNSRKSRNAKGMDIFTTMITKQEQSFVDKTEEKQGFSWLSFGKKKKK